MKRELKALTVAVSLIASGASAFEVNLTRTELSRIKGERMIGELTVVIQALLHGFTSLCVIDGKSYLPSNSVIETDPADYFQYYRIQLETDGEFTMTYGPSRDGTKSFPQLGRALCGSNDLLDDPELTYIPVKSINGFTDLRSFATDLANKGYE